MLGGIGADGERKLALKLFFLNRTVSNVYVLSIEGLSLRTLTWKTFDRLEQLGLLSSVRAVDWSYSGK